MEVAINISDPRKRVKIWMAINEKSQKELADELEITPTTLSLILGGRIPAPATAIRFRDVCDIPVDLWYEDYRRGA